MTVTGGTALPKRRLRTKVSLNPSGPAAGVVKACPAAAARAIFSSAPAAAASVRKPTPTAYGDYVVEDGHALYSIVKGALTPHMMEQLEEFLLGEDPQPAKMKNENAGESDDERKERYDDRDSLVSWFRAHSDCPWLHDLFLDIGQQVANIRWPILKCSADGRLDCECEDTQFAVYGPRQHFAAWHQDAYQTGTDPEDARQITMVTMVSKRSAFTGGDFQVKLPKPGTKKMVIRNLKLEAGDCLVFPAKKLVHRVKAVETGTRRTLVSWLFDRSSSKYHTVGAGANSTSGSGILGPAA